MKAFGRVLWNAVTQHLNLLEADYFDLEYTDEKTIQVRSNITPLRSLGLGNCMLKVTVHVCYKKLNAWL